MSLTPAEEALTDYLAATPDAIIGMSVRDLIKVYRTGAEAQRKVAEVRAWVDRFPHFGIGSSIRTELLAILDGTEEEKP